MAQRRMFSNRIANSARFLQMPAEAQLLYFHMVLRADDDGIVEAYPILKLLGTPSDNMKVLLAKGMIRQLNEDQVVVITEWKEHNQIRADRKVNSIYLALLVEKYPELPITIPKPRSDVEDNSRRLTGGLSTVSIGKVSIGKDSIKEKEICFRLKSWNENQASPIQSFMPENIVSKYGAPRIEKLLEKWGKEDNGFSMFLGELKK